MFRQVFESDSPTYIDAPSTPGPYNGYLVVPPRVFGESITGVTAFFTSKEQTATSNFVLNAYCTLDITTFPGFKFTRFRFDGVSGAYLDRTDQAMGSAFDQDVYQSRDGSLWREDDTGPVFEIDPLTFEEISGTRQAPSKYGTSSLHLPMVDRALDLIVMQSGHENTNQIGVYDFTSGALVRRITVSGEVRDILPEDDRRCYVRSDHDILNLVDYSTGAILSTLRAPAAGAVDYRLAWDRYYRRLLVFALRADASNGGCTSTAAGYYPVPLATKISAPVPLQAVRANRSSAFLSKVYGDAGEAIAGARLMASLGSAHLIGAPPFTDADGEAIVTVVADAPGSDTLTVSVTI